MAISKEAYKALESIVGKEYISSDPVICEGYRSGPGGYECGLGYERVMTKIPGGVIMPRTTEEVQKIVKA
jgi:FAD/FMN-containing dehydrogenase